MSDEAKQYEYRTNYQIYLGNLEGIIAAELELAAEIQAGNLPTDIPESADFELSASMTPAKEVGGDFYDFFMIDDDHIALVIADVSGKGVPAALFMMMSKNVIKSFAMTGLDPAGVLDKANQTLCVSNGAFMFVTVWLGIYEISAGHMIAANGGHEYPIIRQD